MEMNHRVASSCVMVLLLALGGCSTTTDLRSQMPEREFTSKKSAKDFSGCVADGLERVFPRGIQGRPTSKGYAVTKDDNIVGWGTHSAFAADFEDQPNGGSVVKTYFAWDQSSVKSRYLRVVDDCK